MGHASENSPSPDVKGCEIIIFQSFGGATFFKNCNLLGQNLKSDGKGTKMLRTTSGMDLDQLVFCDPIGCPNRRFSP